MESGMIIFDTNLLLRLRVTGPVAAILRGIANDWGLTLAISSVTRDEYHAWHLRDFEEKINSARRANVDLRKVAPDWNSPAYPSADALVEQKMGRVLSIFTVLPLDGSHAIEALRREAFRQRPASVDKRGAGARDVAIWLTALEQSLRLDATVYLLADDSPAFGKDSLHEDLVAEAEAVGADVTLFTRTEDLIADFATPIDIEIDIEGLLRAPEVTRAVRDTMSLSSYMVAAYAITIESSRQGETITGHSSGLVEYVKLIKLEDAAVYDLENSHWIAARGTWSGHRIMMGQVAGGSSREWRVELQQELTVLLHRFSPVEVYDDDADADEADADEIIVTAEVMGWDDPRILDIRSSHTVSLDTATETVDLG